ncbi:MAG: ABC transporter permease [Ilumatobacteraceae bacterium]
MNTTDLLARPTTSLASTPIRPLRFSTLTSVELRKMTDTRSGRGLIAGVIGLVAVVLAWKVAHAEVSTSFHNYGSGAVQALGFIAPVIALLAMTSEWTQRTALTTLTLAPRRLPVMIAKYTAALVVSLGLIAVGMMLTLGGTALGGAIHGHAVYAGLLGDLRTFTIIVLLQMLMACAFGALAGNTAVALVAFFVAPTVWAAVSTQLLKGAAPWFDVFAAYDQLGSPHPFQHIAESLTAITVWIILPSVIGLTRALRREVK